MRRLESTDCLYTKRIPTLRWLQVYPVWSQYTFGDCSVAVCHIDSGLPWGPNNWYNPGEYSGLPNVDDDGNGMTQLTNIPPA